MKMCNGKQIGHENWHRKLTFRKSNHVDAFGHMPLNKILIQIKIHYNWQAVVLKQVFGNSILFHCLMKNKFFVEVLFIHEKRERFQGCFITCL